MLTMADQCPVCEKRGLHSRLQLFQINMQEAIRLCPHKQCPYPAGSGLSVSDLLVKRRLAEITDLDLPHTTTPTRVGGSATQAKESPSSQHLLKQYSGISEKKGSSLPVDSMDVDFIQNTSSPKIPDFMQTDSSQNALTPKITDFVREVSNQNSSNSLSNQDNNHGFPDLFSEVGFGTATDSHSNLQHNSTLNTGVLRSGVKGAFMEELLGNEGQIQGHPSGNMEQPGTVDCMQKTDCDSIQGKVTKDTTSMDKDELHSSKDKSVRAPPCHMGTLQAVSGQEKGNNGRRLGDNKGPESGDNRKLLNVVDNRDGLKVGDNGVHLNVGDNGELLKVGDNGERLSVGDNGERLKVSDNGDSLSVGDNGERLTVGDIGERLSVDSTYLQWVNRDALCWLDVSMQLLVHSHCFSKFLAAKAFNKKLLLPRLQTVYRSAQDNTRQALQFRHYAWLAQQGRLVTLQTSIGRIVVRTGGGGAPGGANQTLSPLIRGSETSGSKPYSQTLSPIIKDRGCDITKGAKEWVMTPSELQERATSLLTKARKSLVTIRESIFTSLKQRLRCELGRNDSPVFALPLMLREHRLFQDYFKLKYYWQMDCTECGYQHIDEQEKNLPSFPEVTSEFCMQRPHFLRSCFACESPQQRMSLCYESLPDAILAHFVEGLKGASVCDYDFSHQGVWYAVRAVVQYTNAPDHFVAWLRNTHNNQWMECDDLKPDICHFSDKPPSFPLSQVHLLMWEKVDPSRPFVPSAGCHRLRALCESYSLPPRKPHTTTLKDGDSHSMRHAYKKRSRVYTEPAIDLVSSSSPDSPLPNTQTPARHTQHITNNKTSNTVHQTVSNQTISKIQEETVAGVSLGGKAAVLVPGLKPLKGGNSLNLQNSSIGNSAGIGRIGNLSSAKNLSSTNVSGTVEKSLKIGNSLNLVKSSIGNSVEVGKVSGAKNLSSMNVSSGNLSNTSGASVSIKDRVNQNLRKILAAKKSGGSLGISGSNSGGSTQADRIQRMRDKLQMAKLMQPGTGVKANLTATFLQGNTGSSKEICNDALKKAEVLDNKTVKPGMSHLMLVEEGVNGDIPSKSPPVVARSVLNSPSHRNSAVKEMLRALKSNKAPAPVTSQTFDGYRPKGKQQQNAHGKKGSQKTVATTTNNAKTKRISFGQEVQVQTMSNNKDNYATSKALKRKMSPVVHHATKPAAKRILVSPKSQASLGISTSAQEKPSEARIGMDNMDAAQPNLAVGEKNDNPIDLLSDLSETLTKNHRVTIPQLSPCSLQSGQTTTPNPQLFSPGGSHLQGSVQGSVGDSSIAFLSPMGASGKNNTQGGLEDVIGELCATLEEHTPVKLTSSPGKQTSHLSPVLDANLPPGIDLNTSDLPFDFDPSLFGDSPIKTGFF